MSGRFHQRGDNFPKPTIRRFQEERFDSTYKTERSSISNLISLEVVEQYYNKLQNVIENALLPIIIYDEKVKLYQIRDEFGKIVLIWPLLCDSYDLIHLIQKIMPNSYTMGDILPTHLKINYIDKKKYGGAVLGGILELTEAEFINNKKYITKDKWIQYFDNWNEGVLQANQYIKSRLEDNLIRELEKRKNELVAINNTFNSLGFELNTKENVVFADLTKKVKISKSREKNRMSIDQPEVVKQYKFRQNDVNSVLSVYNTLGMVLESAANHFNEMEEEAIRFIYLAALNSVFEIDGQAEAFRNKGKTDILISLPEYENTIITEFKKWAGASNHNETLIQAKGYRTWRDSNLILVIIVNNVKIADKIESARKIIEKREDIIGVVKKLNSGILLSEHSIDDQFVNVYQLFVHLPPSE
ncbi:MAG: hypothetical protein INQ03_04140 [Candidatus Heimdallarchaeota archaeon]|nr:hypothetical protein [Candidatus Heimdallarchaeota archaeon]